MTGVRRYLPWIGIAILVVFMVVAVVGFGGGSEPEGPAANDTGIAPQDLALVAAGEPLYQSYCAACHGVDLRGTAVGPSHLSIVYEPNHHSDTAFLLAVRNGVRQHHWPFGDMAPVPGLSDDDIEAIIAYVRAQQRLNGFEPYPPSS